MMMNALNGVLPDIYILQIITPEELENLTKCSESKLDFKVIKFPILVRDIHEIFYLIFAKFLIVLNHFQLLINPILSAKK